MKKTGIFFLIICFLICFLCTPVVATSIESTAPETVQETIMASSCHGIDAGGALLGTQQIVDNANAVVLYEATSDTLLHTWNADEKMYPASFVKIMTALIAVENAQISDVVTVTESAVSSIAYDAVSADLLSGEQISVEDLLYCLLVGSANDAAAVLAEHISGSQSAFVQKMNERALELGCTGTQFMNPHGLHDDGQYTTARDSARILNAAIKNEIFRTVFTTKEHTVAATNLSEERLLTSGNSMMDTSSKLYYDERVIGGRTGVTQDGRRCLASVAEKNGMQLICIVMGSGSVYQEDGYSAVLVGGYHETTALLDTGLDGYKAVQVLFANQSLRQYDVTNGDSDLVVGPRISVSAVLPEAVSTADLTMRYTDKPIEAPVTAGQSVSEVEVWYGNMCVAQAELFALNSVKPNNSVTTSVGEQRDNSAWSNVAWIILCIILAVLMCLIVLPRFIGRIRILTAKKRSKNYRRNRRRSR